MLIGAVASTISLMRAGLIEPRALLRIHAPKVCYRVCGLRQAERLRTEWSYLAQSGAPL